MATIEILRTNSDPPTPKRKWAKPSRAPRGLEIIGIVIAAMFAAPLVYLIARNFAAPNELLSAVTSSQVGAPLVRTLLLASSVMVACALLGTAMAWLTTRTDIYGRRALAVVAALPLVLPSFVAALAFVGTFSSGGLLEETFGIDPGVRVQGFWAAFTVLTLISYPYVYLPVAARLIGLPRSLEESASSLGRHPLAVFRTVVFPQITGAILAGSMLVFLYVVSEFGAVSLLQYDTLTRRIYASRLLDPNAAMAMSLVLAVVAITVVVVERIATKRRHVIESPGTQGAPKRVLLGHWRIASTCFGWGLVGLALFVPVAVVTHWAWLGLTGTRNVLGRGMDIGRLVQPTINTALLGVGAAVVAIIVVLPVAYLTARYRSRVGGFANALVVGGFALPGLVIALALVGASLRIPFLDHLYQTFPLLIFAYVVHFGAQAMRSAQVSVEAVPRHLRDAARSLGAGRVRRFRTVELPLMAPALAAGCGLVLLSVMKELPATLLLAPIGVDTLAIRIWSASSEGFYAQAGLASVMLVALAAVLTWLLTIRHMERL